MQLSELEKKILNIIQVDFPITPRPFKDIGEKVGITEEKAFEIIKSLVDKGIIRRIGATFDSKKLNYASTLCAAKVPENKIDEFVKVVNEYIGVTHNYYRNDEYNIWFTFIGKSMEDIENKLKEISKKTGIEDIINLPAKKMFKVRVDLNV